MLAPGMALRFAPVSVPLERRIQTVAVLQWIFSFLLLGNSLPPPPCPRRKGRGEERRGGGFLLCPEPRASGCFGAAPGLGVFSWQGALDAFPPLGLLLPVESFRDTFLKC